MSKITNSTCTPIRHPFFSEDLHKALRDDVAFFSTAHSRRYRVRRAIPQEARLAGDASQSPAQVGCEWYIAVENSFQPRRRMIQLGAEFEPETASEELANALYDIARIELKVCEANNE